MKQVLLVLAVGLTACVDQQAVRANLESALQARYFPNVVACWEREFEATGFEKNYLAHVDLVVSGGTGNIREASVTQVLDGDAPVGEREAAFSKCVADGLNASTLKPGGFVPDSDVAVRGLPIAFVDASSAAREAASERAPNVLIGPRAARCQGLFSHDPPRESAILEGQLAESEATASRAKSSDQAGYARALQNSYDLALELRERLSIDTQRQDLPMANRQRFYEALDRVGEHAQEIGDKIGCNVPELKR